MANKIAEAINRLRKTDVMSLVLFALYKIKDIPEYSTLSELLYLLDEKSFTNFIDYYGGTTIRVPTKQELKLVINALLLYEFTKLDGVKMSSALKMLCATDKSYSQKELLTTYKTLVEVLNKYDFKRK